MYEGDKVKLYCHVQTSLKDENDNWKTCMWIPKSRGGKCRYEYKKVDGENGLRIVGSCSRLRAHYQFFGNINSSQEFNHLCGIIIPSASHLDNTEWTCKIMQCKNVNLGGCGANDGNDNIVEATMNVTVIIF